VAGSRAKGDPMMSRSLTRRSLTRLILLALLAVAPTWGLSSAHAATRGGTLTFARAMDSLYLDPVHTSQNADIWISLNLYDTLIQPTTDGKGIAPGLAESWTVSDDGKAVTLKIRPNLKFADGSPIELSDIKWSLDRASNKETGGDFQFLLSAIQSTEITGTDTVVLHLAHADPSILQALATFNAGIMPEKLLMAAPGKDLEEKSKNFADHPIGSGPFVLTSWSRNNEMVLSRNPYYWKLATDGKPLPYLDKVRFVIIPDDATRILKLKAGEIDATEFVPFSRVAELKADPKLNMVLFPSSKVIYFNLNDRPTYKDGSKNPTADARVRQALNYATDKQAMIQILSYGFGVPQQSFMPMSTPLAYGKGEPYPIDIAKAKALLKEAGYANGFEITCMALAGNQDDVAQLSALQQMWGQVGVRLKIEQLESATRLTKFKAGDYQMRTSLWTNDINDPNEITSYFVYYPIVQSNRSGWRDEALEKLFMQSQEEMDLAKRGALYQQIQESYVAQAPIIFLLEVPYPIAMLKKVHDFVQIPLGNNVFIDTYLE
jgi:peptide/nickel transport system substrate-binding protein